MSKPYAKVIKDSITETGRRLTTMEVGFHRFVLSEWNTHRVFSRNSASSRAIPVEKQLERLRTDPAWPLEWPSEQPGMQGGTPLEDEDLRAAQLLFIAVQEHTARNIGAYLDQHPRKPTRLHKSLVNRLIEPFMRHVVVVTSTAWENFFRQRVSPLAQPEIREPAALMLDAYKQSEPELLGIGRWHLPYTDEEDRNQVRGIIGQLDEVAVDEFLVPISSARCARVSYLTHDGRRDFTEDFRLYEGDHARKGLITNEPMHASPLEHVATPALWNEHTLILVSNPIGRRGGRVRPLTEHEVARYREQGRSDGYEITLPLVGNFLGWQQHRLEIEMTRPYQFFA